jgi:iron complex transport system ATP-binding protein
MSIRVTDLCLQRGERRLMDGVSFDVPDASIHAIVGGNGTGKSTLLAALAGDLIPARGLIHLDGIELAQLSDPAQAHRRAVLMQHQPALPYSPRDLIALADPSADDDRTRKLLTDFDLEEFADRRLSTLSGGERGRAMLAMTIAQAAGTLLLDEPTAAFDRDYRRRFVEWLVQWRAAGHAIVVVTHDAEIEAVADSITSLN